MSKKAIARQALFSQYSEYIAFRQGIKNLLNPDNYTVKSKYLNSTQHNCEQEKETATKSSHPQSLLLNANSC